MHFIRAEIVPVVKTIKLFRKGLATLGTFISLVSFCRFAVFVNFIVTAHKTVHEDNQKSLLASLDASHSFLMHDRLSYSFVLVSNI